MSHNHDSLEWTTKNVCEWDKYEAYMELHTTCNNMQVVNDPAERIVQLAEEKMKSARGEEKFQESILFVDEMRRLADGFKRNTFTKQQLQSVVERMLTGTEEV